MSQPSQPQRLPAFSPSNIPTPDEACGWRVSNGVCAVQPLGCAISSRCAPPLQTYSLSSLPLTQIVHVEECQVSNVCEHVVTCFAGILFTFPTVHIRRVSPKSASRNSEQLLGSQRTKTGDSYLWKCQLPGFPKCEGLWSQRSVASRSRLPE